MAKVSEGNAKVEISEEVEEMIEDLVRKAFPEAIAVFESNLEKIKIHAQANWPVRQAVRIMRDADGQIVKRKDGSTVVFKNPPSKRSVDKFKIETKISGGAIITSLINTAPYAYMIRMGIDSKGKSGDLYMPLGARVWDNVVFSPVKKQTKKVAEEYANVLVKLQEG